MIYYIILYIILYFNSPRRIKSKEFLQFIFFHSPHRPKPKDFLQLILMIFLLWISFKKHEEIRFLRQISFNAPHQVDQIYPRAVDELPPCPPLKSPNLVFRVKITVLYRPFFQKQNVISQVLALTRNKTWPFFHKKHQINKFGFLSCWRGFIFIRIFFPSTCEIYWCFAI